MLLALWRLGSDETLSRTDTDNLVWLTADGDGDILPSQADPASTVTIVPIDPSNANDGVIAAAVVPPQIQSRVFQNGLPMPAGLHVLKSRDRLEIGKQRFWISATSAVERAVYDSATHGENIFCFMTKARLTAGEEIVICRGNAGGVCGTIYKVQAWEAASDSGSGFKCPNCGFDPSEPEWQPKIQKKQSLDDLHRLIGERGNSNA